MLFLPQFVVVVAFPSMSTAHERRRAMVRSLTLIAGLGVLGTLAAWLLAPLAMVFAEEPDSPRSSRTCGSSPSSARCCP